MDERAALGLLSDELAAAGDDAAVVNGLVVTTDMLHERTDFPPGTTRYTAGWRAVGASLPVGRRGDGCRGHGRRRRLRRARPIRP